MQQQKFTISISRIMILLLFIIPFGVFNNNVNYVFLYAVMPLVFLYCFFTSLNTIKNQNIKLLFLLIIWSFICTFMSSASFMVSLEVLKLMVFTFMFCYSIAVLSKKNEKYINWFYFLFLSFYLINWYYAIFHFNLLQIDIESEIFGADNLISEKINANRWGYFTLFLTFAAFIYGELCQSKKWRKFFRYLFIFTIIMAVFNALFTGSRQVLLLNVPLYFILLFFRYKKVIFNPKRVSGMFLFIILLLLFVRLLMPFYENSRVKKRADKTVLTEDARYKLIAIGFNYGINNPVFGIGPGNINYYEEAFSHCSYTEIFGETGLIGLILYVSILFGSLKVQLKRYKETKDKVFLYFAIYAVFFIINNFFYVFYEWYLLMGIIYLLSAHSDSYYKRNYARLNGNPSPDNLVTA